MSGIDRMIINTRGESVRLVEPYVHSPQGTVALSVRVLADRHYITHEMGANLHRCVLELTTEQAGALILSIANAAGLACEVREPEGPEQRCIPFRKVVPGAPAGQGRAPDEGPPDAPAAA